MFVPSSFLSSFLVFWRLRMRWWRTWEVAPPETIINMVPTGTLELSDVYKFFRRMKRTATACKRFNHRVHCTHVTSLQRSTLHISVWENHFYFLEKRDGTFRWRWGLDVTAKQRCWEMFWVSRITSTCHCWSRFPAGTWRSNTDQVERDHRSKTLVWDLRRDVFSRFQRSERVETFSRSRRWPSEGVWD